MADTLKVPGVGPTKKGYVIAGAGIVAGILAVAYYRHSQSTAAAAAAAPAIGTSATDPNAIDPTTGLTYAEEAAQASQGAYNQYDSGLAYGSGSVIGYDAYGNPVYSSGGGSTGTPGSYTTNGQWAQAAEEYLTSSASADPTVVAAALGKYLTGQPVTTAQQDVIDQAIAFANYPPVNGPNGYPPNIKLVASGQGSPPPSGGGTGSGNGLITVPDLAGKSAGDAHNALVALGLVPVAPPSQRANMKVWYTNPRAGSMVSKGTHVTIDTKGYV